MATVLLLPAGLDSATANIAFGSQNDPGRDGFLAERTGGQDVFWDGVSSLLMRGGPLVALGANPHIVFIFFILPTPRYPASSDGVSIEFLGAEGAGFGFCETESSKKFFLYRPRLALVFDVGPANVA